MAFSLSFAGASVAVLCEILNIEMRKNKFINYTQYTFNAWWKKCESSRLEFLYKDDKKLLLSMILVASFSTFLSASLTTFSLMSTVQRITLLYVLHHIFQ